MFGGMGITCGAHRLWAHRSYKANYKMRMILCIANLIAFQNSIYEWVSVDIDMESNVVKIDMK